jgi:CcmD family protein
LSSNLIAMTVTLIVWIGLFFYLLRLDRRVARLEKETKRS